MATQAEMPVPTSGMPGFPVQVKAEPHDWTMPSVGQNDPSSCTYTNLDNQQNGLPNNLGDNAVQNQATDVPQKKKRGRKPGVKQTKKKQDAAASTNELPGGVTIKQEIKQEQITDTMKVKKKRDRFHGMTEEEVAKKTLPDLICPNLDILIIGINPGLTAAYVGHHYAGPGNHFWKCVYLSGLIPEPLNAYSDGELIKYGIGFTSIVPRTTRGSADLSRKEIKEGGELLKLKVLKYKPRIAVFNGKGIYEVFSGRKDFHFGKQPDHFPDCPETLIYVMPSSSARCSQLPRAVDKVPFYAALKKLRDFLRGTIQQISDEDVYFKDLVLETAKKKDPADAVKKEGGEAGTNGANAAAAAGGDKAKDKPKKPPRKRKSTGKTVEQTPASSVAGSIVPGTAISTAPTPVTSPSQSNMMIHPGVNPAMFPNGMAPQVKQEPGMGGGCSMGAGGSPSGFTPYQPPLPEDQQGPTLDALFGNGAPSLVKQEDLSDLVKYGLVPPPPMSNSTMYASSNGSNYAPMPPPPPFFPLGSPPPPAHSHSMAPPNMGASPPPFLHHPGFPSPPTTSSVVLQNPFEDVMAAAAAASTPHSTAATTSHLHQQQQAITAATSTATTTMPQHSAFSYLSTPHPTGATNPAMSATTAGPPHPGPGSQPMAQHPYWSYANQYSSLPPHLQQQQQPPPLQHHPATAAAAPLVVQPDNADTHSTQPSTSQPAN